MGAIECVSASLRTCYYTLYTLFNMLRSIFVLAVFAALAASEFSDHVTELPQEAATVPEAGFEDGSKPDQIPDPLFPKGDPTFGPAEGNEDPAFHNFIVGGHPTSPTTAAVQVSDNDDPNQIPDPLFPKGDPTFGPAEGNEDPAFHNLPNGASPQKPCRSLSAATQIRFQILSSPRVTLPLGRLKGTKTLPSTHSLLVGTKHR